MDKGFVGPQGFGEEIRILADHSVRAGGNWITGANAPDMHVSGANQDRDFRIDEFHDLVQIREGDRCPTDGGELRIGRSIVVGHIYQLGTKYSQPLEANFLDEDGERRYYQMGCYGIGISRILAAVVEQHHDGSGIIWPRALAPFEAIIVMANQDDEPVRLAAESVYRALAERGISVLLDDRDERAGVKFADADLIGYPVQLIVGRRGVQSGSIDLKLRATGERSSAPLDDAAGAAARSLEGAP